jgi:GTPase
MSPVPASPPPVIAIIGRPNVGKSTLYNRLTGTRNALVSDLPGLTRDRREGAAEVGGRAVVVVDTAGLEEGAPGSIPARMRKQSETAMESADLILFVIDQRAGVTPVDEAFSRLVMATGKPAILVANKCEGKRGFDSLFEAFSLGLGEPVPISAEHGEGLGELDRDIAAALGFKPRGTARGGARRKRLGATVDELAKEEEPLEPADTSERPLRVAIIGRPNVGKSTLVNAILGEERMLTGPEPGLTRDAVATNFDWEGHPVRLFDTAGLRRKAKVTEYAEKLGVVDTLRAVRFAEVAVLVIDAERAFEHQDLAIAELVIDEGRALVIAVNKWDLVADKQKAMNELREAVTERLGQVQGIKLVMVSAIGERGLDKLMQAIMAANEVWNRRVSTGDLNRWLAIATSRHAPPASHGRRIKIRYMTQPTTRPPTFVGFCQRADAMPMSYKRYLINSIREAFDLPGVPIRFNLRKGDNPFAAKK